jgi:uncharacterized membrane protein SpoIIM required for sporulation/ABC-type transport system involved in multi-copper enzyme maturation permease subunit
MVSTAETSRNWQSALRLTLTITAREIRDVLRDWRLVAPILFLTIFFPVLANFTADEMVQFLNRYGGDIIGERLIPFLLMIVGFFPISFSLVIALETFVGEKERKSLEPLLSSPLSDTQLYMGKTLAAAIVPLAASYLGIAIYLAALYIFQGWTTPSLLLFQIVALTTGEAFVMVSGAVIISSQTTSVRAANLLASFIIIPMALLVQAESIIMFWARYDTLWWILLFLLVGNALLARMGLRLFNREELLGREIDVMRLSRLWQTWRSHLVWDWWLGKRTRESVPRPLRWLGVLAGLYLREVPAILRRSRAPLLVVAAGMVGALAIGWYLAVQYPLPPAAIFSGSLGDSASGELLTGGAPVILSPAIILGHNLRALLLSALFSIFSFGSLAVAALMITPAIATYLVIHVAWAGYSPGLFLLALVAPHGILEIPAAMLATALGVRLGAAFVAPPRGMPVGEAWLQALADFVKIFLAVVLPLLAVAAWIESYITPQIALLIYGG